MGRRCRQPVVFYYPQQVQQASPVRLQVQTPSCATPKIVPKSDVYSGGTDAKAKANESFSNPKIILQSEQKEKLGLDNSIRYASNFYTVKINGNDHLIYSYQEPGVKEKSVRIMSAKDATDLRAKNELFVGAGATTWKPASKSLAEHIKNLEKTIVPAVPTDTQPKPIEQVKPANLDDKAIIKKDEKVEAIRTEQKRDDVKIIIGDKDPKDQSAAEYANRTKINFEDTKVNHSVPQVAEEPTIDHPTLVDIKSLEIEPKKSPASNIKMPEEPAKYECPASESWVEKNTKGKKLDPNINLTLADLLPLADKKGSITVENLQAIPNDRPIAVTFAPDPKADTDARTAINQLITEEMKLEAEKKHPPIEITPDQKIEEKAITLPNIFGPESTMFIGFGAQELTKEIFNGATAVKQGWEAFNNIKESKQHPPIEFFDGSEGPPPIEIFTEPKVDIPTPMQTEAKPTTEENPPKTIELFTPFTITNAGELSKLRISSSIPTKTQFNGSAFIVNSKNDLGLIYTTDKGKFVAFKFTYDDKQKSIMLQASKNDTKEQAWEAINKSNPLPFIELSKDGFDYPNKAAVGFIKILSKQGDQVANQLNIVLKQASLILENGKVTNQTSK